MKSSQTVLMLGALVALSACATAGSQRSEARVAGSQCDSLADVSTQVGELLAASNVQRVEPSYEMRHYAGGPQPMHVSGAKLYVPAQPGMSAPYLERALSCYAASGEIAAAQPNDPLRVEGIRDVDVRGAGQSFRIAIIGSHQRSGEAIWERARALGDSQVTVEQIAAAGATPAL